MPFSEDDNILIKGLRQEKHYGAKQLKTEFPNKYWTLTGLKKRYGRSMTLALLNARVAVDESALLARPRTLSCLLYTSDAADE